MDRGRTERDTRLTGVYLYRLRSILRQRWTDYLLLMLLITLVGGLAMGSVVAGRRTQSAYAAFLGRDNASTLTMSTYGVFGGVAVNNFSPQIEQSISRLPQVAHVESWIATYILPLTPTGLPDLADTAGLNVAGSIDGVFFDEDRVTVLKGRMADPGDPHEFMTSETGARLLGIHLGQTLQFGAFDQTTATQPGFADTPVPPARRLALRLVAIVQFNNAVVEDEADRTPTNLVITPALARTQENAGNGTWFAIRLKPGVKDINRLEQHLLQFLQPGSIGQFYLASTTEAKVESALRPESIAFGVFGLIAALAALGLCLPIVARLKVNGEDDRKVLRSIGAPRSVVAADLYVGVTVSVLVGTVLACVVASVLGSFAPLGPVNTVFHPRSFAPDWTVTLAGAAILVGVLCGTALVAGLRLPDPGRTDAQASPRPAGGGPGDVVAAAGLPAAAVVGTRFALERGHGRTSVAARSLLIGGVLSVTLVVATLAFASGLRTLVNRPALYGWDWNYTVIGSSNVPPDSLSALSRDPRVQSWSGYIGITITIDGRSVPVLIATDSLDVTPPRLSGRSVGGNGQLILGQATLAALHKRVGDTVAIGFGSPHTAPLYLPPLPMKVVGTATFPAVGGSSNFADHTSMGVGGLFSFASLPAWFNQATQNPDPVQNGPALVFVRFRPGTSRSAALADVRRVVALGKRQFAGDPQAAGNDLSFLRVQRPAAIVNYQSTGDTPLVLAFGLAAAATVALAVSMVASVRRRRRDLAVLKTLGFVRRQMLATVATQALVSAVISIALGLPLGIAAGRQLWIAFAHSIYAVPEPTVPASVALVAAAAILVAVAVAVVPGRLAARTPAAEVLRAD